MARKKEADITHPGRAHPTFTVEEAKRRELQRQRDKRARRKLEKSRALACTDVDDPAPAALEGQEESSSSKIAPPSCINEERLNKKAFWLKELAKA